MKIDKIAKTNGAFNLLRIPQPSNIASCSGFRNCKWTPQNVSGIRKCKWNPQNLEAESANCKGTQKFVYY